ncbi:MAG TPA: hypothetical protein VMV10_33065 [Pirellulales bacterium]|nr:hypothetical protein [Pirellulales bacterium]
MRILFWLTLVVAAFLGGIGFQRERGRVQREREAFAREVKKLHAAPGPVQPRYIKDWPIPE